MKKITSIILNTLALVSFGYVALQLFSLFNMNGWDRMFHSEDTIFALIVATAVGLASNYLMQLLNIIPFVGISRIWRKQKATGNTRNKKQEVSVLTPTEVVANETSSQSEPVIPAEEVEAPTPTEEVEAVEEHHKQSTTQADEELVIAGCPDDARVTEADQETGKA